MHETLDLLFNWKKYPAGVLYFALPLASLGFILSLAHAVIEITANGDWVYLCITLVGFIMFVVCMIAPLRLYRQIHKDKS